MGKQPYGISFFRRITATKIGLYSLIYAGRMEKCVTERMLARVHAQDDFRFLFNWPVFPQITPG